MLTRQICYLTQTKSLIPITHWFAAAVPVVSGNLLPSTCLPPITAKAVNVIFELRELYPDAISKEMISLPDALASINKKTGQKFIILIDEWDCLIRDEPETIQEEYINLLRGLFKGIHSTSFLHLAYLTGILPIKKIRTQSALNNFDEFTMLDAKVFAPYIGFTEDEVIGLCRQYGRDFEEVKRWYDGYLLANVHVYNPKAVVSLMMWGEFQSY